MKLPLTGRIGLAIVAIVVLLAALSLVWTPYDPLHAIPADRLSPSSAAHWLGTDRYGRDTASRIMAGSRITLFVGIVAVTISAVFGTLLGIVAGSVVAGSLGYMHFDKVAAAPWVDAVLPFHFGMPEFRLVPIATMCVVMVVVMVESLGMFLALGEMTGKRVGQDELTRGLRADGVGTFLGGVFYSVNMLPDSVRFVTLADPIFYMVDAARYAALGSSDLNPYPAMVMIVVFAALSFAGACWAINRAPTLRH